MTLRVVFLGNSGNVFSHRFFEALSKTPARVVAVVDVPPAKRVSSIRDAAAGPFNFVEAARQDGVPTFEPTNPNAPHIVADLAALQPAARFCRDAGIKTGDRLTP